jgi:hypothetical protein
MIANWRGERRVKSDRLKVAAAAAIVCVVLAGTPLAASAAGGTGSNPNSAFCKLEKTTLATNSPTSKKEQAVAKALESGNWKVAKKDLLSLDGQTGKLEQELISAVSSAPAKVKSAAQQSLKLVPAELNAIKNSTSVAQFTAAEQKATSGAAFQKAATILENYDTTQCGTN